MRGIVWLRKGGLGWGGYTRSDKWDKGLGKVPHRLRSWCTRSTVQVRHGAQEMPRSMGKVCKWYHVSQGGSAQKDVCSMGRYTSMQERHCMVRNDVQGRCTSDWCQCRGARECGWKKTYCSNMCFSPQISPLLSGEIGMENCKLQDLNCQSYNCGLLGNLS